MSDEQRRWPPGSRFGALVLGASLVAWIAAVPAAAQEPFDVTVYHSLDELGADPRPASPPGCTGTGGVPGGSGGPFNVLVFGNLYTSYGLNAQTDLEALGHTVTNQLSLPADLSPFDSIWFIGSAALTADEQNALIAFAGGGGGLYMSGERPCCETLNDSVEVVVDALVAGTDVAIGDQGDIGGPYDFNSAAVGGIATTPNPLATWTPSAPGGIDATPPLDPENVLVGGVEGFPVAGVWDSDDLVSGVGRLVVMMDFNWFGTAERTPVIHNIQEFLGSGSGGSGVQCVIHGSANEELVLWIDGGPSASGDEQICMLGEGGGSGDELCGADILFQLTGVGVFERFEAAAGMDTLVYKPDCVFDGETEQCLLPPGTTQLRMNFLSGLVIPGTGPRRLGSLFVNSTGLDENTSTTVTAFGEAAGANLQSRPIASAEEPEVVAVSEVPEPGGIFQLASGLLGLGFLYRLRRRS